MISLFPLARILAASIAVKDTAPDGAASNCLDGIDA